MDGMEEGVPAGVYRNTSWSKRSELCWKGDSGPRPEARKEEKGERRAAKVTPEFAGAVGKKDTLRQLAPGRSWDRSLNAVDEDKGDISEEVREDVACVVFAGGERERAVARRRRRRRRSWIMKK